MNDPEARRKSERNAKLLFGSTVGTLGLTAAGALIAMARKPNRGYGGELQDNVEVVMDDRARRYADYLWNLPVGEGEYIPYEDFH